MSFARGIQPRASFALLAVALRAIPAPAQGSERLGAVHFPNSGAPAAQPAFLRGVALAHSFSQRAHGAFREAQRIDPRFALAYWLEAYAWRDPLGRSETLDSARSALLRLALTRHERLARAGTPRERAWGAAIEALFANDSTPARVAAFADSMRAVVRQYPNDIDALVVASFALQSIPRVSLARRAALTAEATALAERAFALAPEHPGAAHAMIHVFDDNHPATATRALGAARAYATIAADNTHALHMPSHIFLQLGVWDGVEVANRNALALSARERLGSAPPPADGRWRTVDWHSSNWLYYALVQQGKLRDARMLDDSVNVMLDLAGPGAVDSLGSPDARMGRGMRALQRAAALLDPAEYGRLAPHLSSSDIARLRTSGVEWVEPVFLPGLAAAIRGDTVVASAALQRIITESAKKPSGTLRTQRASVWTGEIEAMMARGRGDTATALARLRAAAVDDTVSVGGPPRWWPAGELLGVTLLEYGRPREAATECAATLERFPNRASAQLGLARARLAAGDRRGAIAAYGLLGSTWAHADEELRALAKSEMERASRSR